MNDSPAVPIRTAATVLLVRDGIDGLEVFLLSRVAGMAFAGGMTVFPGGGVDPTDSAPIRLSGPDDAWWAEHLGVAPELARSIVVAAVRELFEETGVLLADARSDDPLRLEDVAAHRLSLAALLGDRPVLAELLRPWDRWVTPIGQPRRFDTFFLLAAEPAGQQARLTTTEAWTGSWWTPASALSAARNGKSALLPPTVAMLEDLVAFDGVSRALATDRQLQVRSPQVISSSGEPLRVRVDDREVAGIGVSTP